MTSIPTSCLPAVGAGPVPEEKASLVDEDERGQMLWVRGLTRLQQQVSRMKLVLNDKPSPISKSEESLTRKDGRILVQIRTNKSLLLTYNL